MDIGKLLKKANSLSEYVEITQDAAENCKKSRIQLNLTSVLALKKIQSLEIEYFNKCNENGIACVIFERMLCLPASKTWGVLGKELLTLLQYWLDAIRKHLIRHSIHWWSFLKLLFKFIREIKAKDASLPNMLVEYTAECLLDLATHNQPDVTQRFEILHCFNIYCSESSRETRFAMRTKFGSYFTKLAVYMAGCGHLPTQYSIMETLIRWLVPRQDQTLRVMSASKWFPAKLYADETVNIFRERQWANFFRDARDFLNSHNNRSQLVMSVICRKFTVGTLDVGTKRLQEVHLDINTSSRCMSVLVDPKVLETFGSTNHSHFETLIIAYDNTITVKLERDSRQLTLSVLTASPPPAMPSHIALGDSCDVTAVVTSRCDIARLDKALRNVFDDKYQVSFDLDKGFALSPLTPVEYSSKGNTSEEDNRFSLPAEVKSWKRSGYVAYSRHHPGNIRSPSTNSTSSLLQLRVKLAALPEYKFDKQQGAVCVPPDLSVVSEASETDSLNTTFKNRHYGVTSIQHKLNKDKKSQSDRESVKKSQKNRGRRLSPVNNEYCPSLLLCATLGTVEESVIDDTVERLSKSKDFDPETIVDLLVQEALQAPDNNDRNDSGINTGEKNVIDNLENSETIENTPNAEINIKKSSKHKSKIISSTSDESNTEAINDTPMCYVNTRSNRKDKVVLVEKYIDHGTEKKKKLIASTSGESNIEAVSSVYCINTRSNKRDKFDPLVKAFSEQRIEQVFTNVTENKDNEVVISPTLARKNNETSSETSYNFCEECDFIDGNVRDNIEPSIFNNIEVIECLNDMVDKVCDELDKCTKYLGIDDEIAYNQENRFPIQEIINRLHDTKARNKEREQSPVPNEDEDDLPLRELLSRVRNTKDKATDSEDSSVIQPKKPSKKIRLKYKNKPSMKDNSRAARGKNKLESELPKMSTIIEADDTTMEKVIAPNIDNDSDLNFENKDKDNPKNNSVGGKTNIETPEIRRKRKLFSPKDDQTDKHDRVDVVEEEKISPESQIKRTPKSIATCYRDIERERKNRIRMPRSRRTKIPESFFSPRTKKNNDIFDQVKASANNEPDTVAYKTSVNDVYNLSSDSEDNFKPKENQTRQTSSATSVKSIVTRRGRVVKPKIQSDMSTDENKPVKRRVNRKPRTKKNVVQTDLIDERMREATQDFNTSILVEKTANPVEEPKLVLDGAPEMELIDDDEDILDGKQKPKSKAIKKIVDPKGQKQPLEIRYLDDRTESPLPGLVVETVSNNKEDHEFSANMVDKLKNIFLDGPEMYINESNTSQNFLSNVEQVNYNLDNEEMIECIQINESQQKKGNARNKTAVHESLPIDKLDIIEKSNPKHKTTRAKTHAVKTHPGKQTTKGKYVSKTDKSSQVSSKGITGHGESTEYPPSIQFITARVKPRSLETENLNQSIEEYFDKLTQEIQRPNRSLENKSKSNQSINSSKSPVVRVTRMTSDDITRWLPFIHNSSDDESYISKQDSQNYSRSGDNTKSSQSNRRLDNTSSTKIKAIAQTTRERDSDRMIELLDIDHGFSNKSPPVPNDNIDSEFHGFPKVTRNSTDNDDDSDSNSEVQELKRKYLSLIYKNTSKNKEENANRSTVNISNKQRKHSEPSKLKPNVSQSVKNSTMSKSIALPDNESEDSEVIQCNVPAKINAVKIKQNKKNINTKGKKRSTISPIKLFEDLNSNADNQSCHLSDDEISITKLNSLKKVTQPSILSKDNSEKNAIDTGSNVSKSSADSGIRKRKSTEEDKSRKKCRVLSEESIGSGGTASNVDVWFKRNEPMCSRTVAPPDNLHHMMENLEKTVGKIKPRSNLEFPTSLFENTQQELSALNEKHFESHKRIATEIMSEINKLATKVIDEKLTDLAMRSQELNNQFMKRLKERTSQLMRAECEQRRAAVLLLRRDVQAVAEHLRRQGDL